MTVDLEDRLWAQLEAAALRETRRGRAGRATAVVRGPFRAWHTGAALAAVAAAAAVVAVLSLTAGRTAPQLSAERVVLHGAHLTAGTAAFGSLWAYDADSGQVLRLDPRSHRVLAHLPFSSPLADVAIAIGPGAVWVVPIQPIRHSVPPPARPRPVSAVRIDPRTNRISARVAVRAPIQPVGIVSSPHAVWIWGEGGALRIDPARGIALSMIGIAGERVTGFAATGTRVSLATELGELVSFDVRTARRLAAVPVNMTTTRGKLVAVGGGVAIGRPGGLLANVDPVSGRDLWVAHLGSQPRDLLATGGRLWALVADPAAGHDVLVALDPGSGRAVAHISLPAGDSRTIGAGAGATPVVTTEDGALLLGR